MPTRSPRRSSTGASAALTGISKLEGQFNFSGVGAGGCEVADELTFVADGSGASGFFEHEGSSVIDAMTVTTERNKLARFSK